jgi:hypothetical protein
MKSFGPRELTKNESYSDVGKLSCEVYFASSCRPQQKSIFKVMQEIISYYYNMGIFVFNFFWLRF